MDQIPECIERDYHQNPVSEPVCPSQGVHQDHPNEGRCEAISHGFMQLLMRFTPNADLAGTSCNVHRFPSLDPICSPRSKSPVATSNSTRNPTPPPHTTCPSCTSAVPTGLFDGPAPTHRRKPRPKPPTHPPRPAPPACEASC